MLNIFMVASEGAPFSKTGGLADVIGSLPSALTKEGAVVSVILPKYGVRSEAMDMSKFGIHTEHLGHIFVDVGWRHQYCGIERSQYKGVTYYFLDNEYYFKRESFYGYQDDGERFAFFCKAVFEVILFLDIAPDILHCHDWQAAMVPVLLEAKYRQREKLRRTTTIITIHNLRYRGIYGVDQMKDWFSLGDAYFTEDKLEFFGAASYLKGGLVYSKAITTVSESYAQEIKEPYYGESLDGLLRARSKELYGIVNGIDYDEYNPAKDELIYQNYTKTKVNLKALNKQELQKELCLEQGDRIPMIGLISRLVDQKGLDLVACVLEEILAKKVQLVVLGTGDEKYETLFRDVSRRFPGKLSVHIGFNSVLAHKIYAGADLFLMPSLFEPCGLGQLISLRYGTLPIVRETGGLKDTVQSYNEVTGEGNGFTFTNYNAHDMLYTIQRALHIYERKTLWNKLRKGAMSCDNSWQSSARKYMELYHNLHTKG